MQSEAHIRPRHSRGFTLVELMIVVAIIGILAAIALPAFSRYVKKSRTVEAVGHLNKMWSSSVAYYESDHATPDGTRTIKQFPGNLSAQEATCCGQAGDKCPGNAAVYQTDAVWIALDFNVPNAHHYRPIYASTGTGGSARFTATAHGDLDCDTTLGTFQRGGSINPTSGDVEGAGAPYVENETE